MGNLEKNLCLEEELGLQKFRNDLKSGKNRIVIDKSFQRAYEQDVINEMKPYFAAVEEWREKSLRSTRVV